MLPTTNIFMMAIHFVVWYFSNLCFSGIDANIFLFFFLYRKSLFYKRIPDRDFYRSFAFKHNLSPCASENYHRHAKAHSS